MHLTNITSAENRALNGALDQSVIETILEDLDTQVTDGLKEIRERDERISELESELEEAREALDTALTVGSDHPGAE